MSSAVVSTSAALGRPFVFDERSEPEVYSPFSDSKKPPHTNELLITRVLQSTIKNRKSAIPLITPASRLEIRPAPEMVSSGIPALDTLTGGLPRGCLTEICGPASSGRSTLMLAALAAATGRGEFCVVIDASDALDPYSVAVAGVELDRMLWVRCGEDSPQRERSPRRHRDAEENKIKDSIQTQNKNPVERLEQVLRATDLLLESGGFGLIVLDLAGLPQEAARRIPLTTWFRFRRAVENKPTILLAIEQYPIAGSCSSLLLKLGSPRNLPGHWEGLAAEQRKTICLGEQSTHDFQIAGTPHMQLLTGMNINAELIRSRLDRKPAHSVTFATKTAWAG